MSKPIHLAAYLCIRLAIAGLAIALGTTGCALTSKSAESWDGLELVKREGLDLVYVRPGAKLAHYSRLMLDPLEVSFDKNWKPEQGDVFRMTRVDPRKIREELAQEFRDVSRRELEVEGRYPIVEEVGPDVLRVRVAIANIYINTSDTAKPGVNYTLVAEPESVTLVAELRDSITNALLARVVDREEGTDTGRLPATNSADARQAIAKWADALRAALNSAHIEAAVAPPVTAAAQ